MKFLVLAKVVGEKKNTGQIWAQVIDFENKWFILAKVEDEKNTGLVLAQVIALENSGFSLSTWRIKKNHWPIHWLT